MSHRFRHECPDGCKVFIGNLDRKTSREQLIHLFGRYGRVLDVWMATNPPGFGFVMYGHRSDARMAVDRMNNTKVDDRYVTVELATGVRRRYSDSPSTSGSSRQRPTRGERYRHRSRSNDRRGVVNGLYNGPSGDHRVSPPISGRRYCRSAGRERRESSDRSESRSPPPSRGQRRQRRYSSSSDSSTDGDSQSNRRKR